MLDWHACVRRLCITNGIIPLQFSRHNLLNDYLEGYRPGELTVLSGTPGCGKTTLLAEIMVDMCAQGVPTLFCSFEVPNVTLIKWMMQQFAL